MTLTNIHSLKSCGVSKYLFSILIGLLLTFLTMPAFAKDYTFSWSPNDGPIDGYNFYYKKGGNPGPPFDGTDALDGESPIILYDKTSFTITGLEDNTTYHFALTACKGLEESDYTDVITVFPGNKKQAVDRRMAMFYIVYDLLLNDE